MAKFEIQSRLNFLLKNNSKNPIAEITFLGTGGAFDLSEKNSSFILKTASGSILIDCGSTVYSQLRLKNMVDSIDYVFITHCHEDHIGSLSTLVYHKYFNEKKSVKIECIPELSKRIETYLSGICGHNEKLRESFEINSNNGIVFRDLNMIIHKINTTGHHYKNYPSSGFVFNFKKSGEDLYVVYSGDIGTSFIEIIEKQNYELYQNLLKKPENVFVFHESTNKEYPPFYPHFPYNKLGKIVKIFSNTFTYHHSKNEAEDIVQFIKNSKLKNDLIKKTIDLELAKKLSLVKNENAKEKLKEQAKRLKEDLNDETYEVFSKIKDLNKFENELIIKEIIN